MSEPEITANEVAVDDTAAETPIVSETVPSDDNDDAENVDDQVLLTNGDNDDDNAQIRLGTTSSARFNILSTMVGGGSLSLPFAFAKSGNVLVGPVLLVTIAFLSEYCFRILVQAARILSYPPNYTDTLQTTTKVGHDSFESLAQAAFGPKAYVASMTLVTLMCFFGTVGYAVLLRDMLEPITAAIYGNQPAGPSWQNNSSLWVIVLVVTPLCTLQTLTSLKRFGAASMFSVLILGCCILFRSSQCNLTDSGRENDNWSHWTDSFQLWPDRWWDVLDAFPLYISCYVCHYNILTVHNELRQPTVPRVTWWLRSTTWTATAFYLIMGVAGSAYGAKCTPSGQVQGNVLLDFDNSDPLLLVGRMCLAITITLAFPMLTIPARDIVLRSLLSTTTNTNTTSAATTTAVTSTETEEGTSSLEEPLLSTENDEEQANGNAVVETDTTPSGSFSFGQRLGVAIVLFWSATAVASCVSSIDVVW
eukprot:CAMPEP_0172447650 /NCGR_PEP_ID=MMETSP1065-20121228/6923_1 /TAXON_ID=265537 /ORGANISM="Amphiprora paludosa, Strain CCMP125" /LENGTH=476 /DNA_ID=CAMNT_0013199011 /DNA_START=37 /DNA_END=1464 /DNA_ORIENTATION=+